MLATRLAPIALAVPALAAAQPLPAAERLVVHDARVYTVDAARPTAEAFAVENGRVVAVGSAAEVRAGREAWPHLALGGRAVVPGFTDAHGHLIGLGVTRLQADLVGTTSLADVVARLKAHEAGLAPGAWLLGRGWDQNDWPPGPDGALPFPTRADLDAAFPDRPVWLSRVDGHADWGNTAALRAAGMDPDAPPPDPAGGQIFRDAAGRATGVFIDAAAAPVQAVVPPLTAEDYAEALRRAVDETARHGLTGVHEAGVPVATFEVYRQAIAAGRFPTRVYSMIVPDEMEAFCAAHPEGIDDPSGRLQVRAVKLYADGALGSRGAALLADYQDAPGSRGLLFYTPEALEALVTRAMACGLQVATHAIGDAGARAVLDAYAAATAATGGGRGRHRLEHAQVMDLADIERVAAMGVVASVQPTHATSDMPWADERLGADRLRGAYAWRRLADAGARIALGSDFPVEHVDPIRGFHAAVTRQNAANEPPGGWYGNQALTRAEALHGFTLGAAWAAFQEDELGSLSVGKRADFVVLSQDLMTVPPEQILATRVLATFLDGAAVFTADGFPAAAR